VLFVLKIISNIILEFSFIIFIFLAEIAYFNTEFIGLTTLLSISVIAEAINPEI
jgi:hypothetical protein